MSKATILIQHRYSPESHVWEALLIPPRDSRGLWPPTVTLGDLDTVRKMAREWAHVLDVEIKEVTA